MPTKKSPRIALFERRYEIARIPLDPFGSDLALQNFIDSTYQGFFVEPHKDPFRLDVLRCIRKEGQSRPEPWVTLRKAKITEGRSSDRQLKIDLKSRRGLICFEQWPVPDNAAFEQPMTDSQLRVFVSAVLAVEDGLLLHSAAVLLEKKAVLFVGPSGSGKTTCSKMFDPKDILTDEIVAIRLEQDESVKVYATPFSGDGQIISKNSFGPLQLGLLLEKSEHTKIAPATFRKVLRNLLECVVVPSGSPEARATCISRCFWEPCSLLPCFACRRYSSSSGRRTLVVLWQRLQILRRSDERNCRK